MIAPGEQRSLVCEVAWFEPRRETAYFEDVAGWARSPALAWSVTKLDDVPRRAR